MEKKSNIYNYNANGQYHGYCKAYYHNGKVWFKGNYDNGIPKGYWKYYYLNGITTVTVYYL